MDLAAILAKANCQRIVLHVVDPVVVKPELFPDKLKIVPMDKLTVMNLRVVTSCAGSGEQQPAGAGGQVVRLGGLALHLETVAPLFITAEEPGRDPTVKLAVAEYRAGAPGLLGAQFNPLATGIDPDMVELYIAR
jgi:hypothetical protein